jgi:hypothetical protein
VDGRLDKLSPPYRHDGQGNFVPWFLAGFQAAWLTVCLAGTIFSSSRYSEIPFPGLVLPISRNHMDQLWRIVEQQGTFLIFPPVLLYTAASSDITRQISWAV